ncbi:uncharacterized protein [Parasteatoda tepidariorum]|uniref:uncharacterized protein n=1 Tax=Parasteatoda tepidariorum TaxID=114398 RepID=UPI00077FB8F5|nr:uncharacterized protein LOC107452361 [Parasteatoda tepidariorum]
MATASDTTLEFFTKASPAQWTYIFTKYKDVLKAKAAKRTKKGGPEELIRMDAWYQEQLPKLIHSRKELYITHEELVQLTKWKLMREKFRPNLIDLVRINTEKAVVTHSKKAFKRLPNLSGAIAMLTCLKGVGPASASAILAAGYPDQAPFMADESMLSTPGVETMDYTVAEYMNYAMQLKKKSDYLNSKDPSQEWNPHKIELTLWAHFVAGELLPSVLNDLPPAEDLPPSPGVEKEDANKNLPDEDSVDSFASREEEYPFPSDSKEQKDNGLEPSAKKLCV